MQTQRSHTCFQSPLSIHYHTSDSEKSIQIDHTPLYACMNITVSTTCVHTEGYYSQQPTGTDGTLFVQAIIMNLLSCIK